MLCDYCLILAALQQSELVSLVLIKDMLCLVYKAIFLIASVDGVGHKDLAWSGGPVHLECEHAAELFTRNGQHIRDNVIATKALVHKDSVYVLTPRLKAGVLATVWRVIEGRCGPELDVFPDLRSHTLADCHALQNAIDFHLDHVGNLWILDIGTIETMTSSPKCTCPPKVMVFNIMLGTVIQSIDISPFVEATSVLQNIVIENSLGEGNKFVYISDASRGAILVYDVGAECGWSVLVSTPTRLMQIALNKHGLSDAKLVIVQLPYRGLVELDTATLQRKHSLTPLTVFGERDKPVVMLGASPRHVFLRHTECTDVLAWDTREAYNGIQLQDIHSPVPRLLTASVTNDWLKHRLVILDTNYIDTLKQGTPLPTYHRVTFLDTL